MEEFSPLFAIQAEKALKANNPQLAIELCKRGLDYFPDYQIGYVLLAEAYEAIGNFEERDKVIETMHNLFPNALTTKAVDNKIKNEGSLVNPSDNLEEIIDNTYEITEENFSATDEDIFYYEEAESQIEDEDDNDSWLYPNYEKKFDTIETSSPEENINENNIEEIIEEAHQAIGSIEETIQEIEEEIQNEIISESEEFIEEILQEIPQNTNEDEIIEFSAELESQISDFQDFVAQNVDESQNIIEISDELILGEENTNELEKDSNYDTSVLFENLSAEKISEVDLISGINYFPFKFDYKEIQRIAQNISLDEYNKINLNLISSDELIEANNFIDDYSSKSQHEPNIKTPKIIRINELKLDIPEDIIPTETLAKIYEKQGKYYEALVIYQKLILKNSTHTPIYKEKIMDIAHKLGADDVIIDYPPIYERSEASEQYDDDFEDIAYYFPGDEIDETIEQVDDDDTKSNDFPF